MRRLIAARGARVTGLLGAVGLLVALGVASPAVAATPGESVAVPVFASLLGDIAHAVLGGVDWTVNVAGDFS
jgi:hypothetical protein